MVATHMNHALAVLFLTRLLAQPHPDTTVATGQSLVCVSVTRPEMRSVGWPMSIGAGCANLDTGEVLGGILNPRGGVKCTFTGALQLGTTCAVLAGCGGLSRVCL